MAVDTSPRVIHGRLARGVRGAALLRPPVPGRQPSSGSRPDRRIVAAVRGAADRWTRDAWLDETRRTRPGDHVVSRCLALVAALAETADGMRSVEIAEQLGVSRATIDRDLEALRRAGVRIETQMVVEDSVAVSRHRLPGA